MKWRIFTRALLTVALTTSVHHATAEDIDVYASNNTSATSNLLIALDNSGAWNGSANTVQCPGVFAGSTVLDKGAGVQACGLWNAMDAINNIPSLLGKLNMGVMLLGAQNVNGGIIKFPTGPLVPPVPAAAPSALVNMDAAGITQMKTVLQGLSTSGGSSNTSNGRDMGGSTWEAWAFYTGKTGPSGTPYPGIPSSFCGKNFVIRVGIADNNSQPGDYNAGQVKTGLQTAGASTQQLQYIGATWAASENKFASSSNYWADEWSRFSKQNNDITTYTITLVDTNATDTQNVASYKRFMKSMADAGGGKAFVVDINNMQEFVQALLAIFNEIQAINSVFAAASLPISVNAQGTFLNQIYFGMFRPDGAGLPRWAGNLKQYQFKLDTTDPLNRRLFLADSTGVEAINPGTGFFSPNAISFWTSKNTAALPDSIDPTGSLGINGGIPGGFFIFRPTGVIQEGFDLPDGEVVEKGGVAQRIRMENLTNTWATAPGTTNNVRRLYTCTPAGGGSPACVADSSLSATPFDVANGAIDATALGAGIPGTPVASIVRTGTTAKVTLSAAMSPALAGGQTVTLAGSGIPQFTGSFAVDAAPAPTATEFYVPVTVLPPTPATGAYTASVPGTSQAITSITRLGATARVNVAGGHGYVNGQTVTISGAGTGYDTVTAITFVDAENFDYPLVVGPTSPATGGTATVGATSGAIVNITRAGTISGFSPFTQRVTVQTASALKFSVGGALVITGATPTGFNNGLGGNPATWTIVATGASCPGAGTPAGRYFCFDMPTTPGAPSAGASVGTTGSSVNITSLTRATSCTGGTPTPQSVVTVTTSAAHTFTAGQKVTIAGTGSSDEVKYLGNQEVLVSPAPTATTFAYQITADPPCSVTSATVPGMTASALGVEKNTLIRWVRGFDDRGDEDGPENGVTVRPSVHGDVLHSRPAVVNYGGTTGVVVFYGSNDGVFRAINGNQSGTIGSIPAGGELWGFIPTEFYSKLKRMYLNTPVVKLESTSTAILPSPQPKDYFFDGNVGVYQELDPVTKVSTKAYIYLTARRGGRIIYALDVTDPANPKFLWKKTDADTGMGELGQTWSTPKVALVKGYNDGAAPTPNPKPVLIFGAGYDPAEDVEPPAARTMGRGIFILDAVTGEIVWQAKFGAANGCSTVGSTTTCTLTDMQYPVPSDITLLDRDTSDDSGFIDRLYVPDLGGNIWRVDLEPTAGNAPSNWTITKFASVGGAATDTTRRKIFFPPDVVPTKNFDAVVFATGDREHPTLTQQSVNIINRFYMLKDTAVGKDGNTTPIQDTTSSTANTALSTVACADANVNCLFNASPTLPAAASPNPIGTPGAQYDNTGRGFYITLLNAVAKRQNDGSILYGPEVEKGEKSVNAPTTIGGTVFWGTNTPITPDPSVCAPNLGTARGYQVNFITGETTFVVFAGGGLPPSPVAGVVTVDGVDVPFLIGGGNPNATGPDATSALGGQEPPIPIAPIRTRTYWYREIGNR